MAIFKRGKLDPTVSDDSAILNPTMSDDAVAQAEARVQSLVSTPAGNSVLDGVSSPATGSVTMPSPVATASSINASPPLSTLNEPSSGSSTLEIHEEGKPDAGPAISLGERKFTTTDRKTEASDAKTEFKPADDAPVDTPSGNDNGSVVDDVDREVNDLVSKLEKEATKLDADINDKQEKIKQLQSEIDEHTVRKGEIDNKITGLKQVVDGSQSPTA